MSLKYQPLIKREECVHLILKFSCDKCVKRTLCAQFIDIETNQILPIKRKTRNHVIDLT